MLVLLLAAGTARAGDDACKPDVERLCAGITPGGGRIAACLKANEAQVSPACKAELASVARKVRELGAACEDDVLSLCPDIKPGQGAVLRCLRDNLFSVTPGCQEVVKGAQEKLAEFQKACGKDARALCKGIKPGQGRVLACLESRKADLSPGCQALMAR
jgi:hypothetical protein